VLELAQADRAIVFCNRKTRTEMICSYLKRFGWRCEALNGDMPQKARERTLERVKAAEPRLHVATDIAARGIDISISGTCSTTTCRVRRGLRPPRGPHRADRKKGVAVSLIRGKYMAHLANLKKQFKVPFEDVDSRREEILWMAS